MIMFHIYMEYWKKIFNYNDNSSIKEFISAMVFNVLLLLLIYCVGLIVPVNLENLIVDIWYIVLAIMIIPTISLIIRLIRKS